MNRPNILFVLVDQLAARWLGVYGGTPVVTPAVDRLAQTGVVFENCYCNNPICAPSRASLFSGRLTSSIEVFDNGCEFPGHVPTFVHHLRAGGYRTALAGKAHFVGPDQLHGFEQRLNAEIYPSSFRWTPSWDKGVAINPGSNVGQVQQSGTCLWGLQLQYDEETCFRALEHLRREARRLEDEPENPFFLNVSFTHPHDPFYTTPEWWDLYEKTDIPMPDQGDAESLHPYNQWLQIHHGVDRYPLTEENVYRARRAYFGMCSYVDSLIGRLLDELDRLKMRDNTIVVFASDHGEMLGEHGMWFKRTYFDESIRVPLIVSWPGGLAGGRRVEPVVSLIDLFPTFCDLGGADERLDCQDSLDGKSLQGLLVTDTPDWKNEAIIEYCGEGVEAPMRVIQRGALKLVDVPGTPLQLFDLARDPREVQNVAGDNQYATVVQELHSRLQELWDPSELHQKIVASQRERQIINDACGVGEAPSWDHDPAIDPRKLYVRTDAQQASSVARYPQVRDPE